MAAEGVVVFDEDPSLTSVRGGFGRTFVVLDERNDVLIFDADTAHEVLAESPTSTEFLIFDTDLTVVESVIAPADFILMDPPKVEAQVVLEGSLEDVLVLTPGGPPGPQGETGMPGPQGQPGPGAYYQEFGFATPSTLWTVVHNQSSLGLNVETVDTSGESIEGDVRFVNPDVLEVEWYFPMAGTARVFR